MQACVRVKWRFGRSAVAVSLRDRFKHSDLETGRFFHKTCQFSVIARRAHSLRPTRQSLTMRFVIPKRNMVARNETEPWNKERESRMKQRIHVFCDRDFCLVSLSRASFRDAMPLALRLLRPRCGLAMTQIWSVFIWKTDVLHFCGYFLRGVAPHRFSKEPLIKSQEWSARDFVPN